MIEINETFPTMLSASLWIDSMQSLVLPMGYALTTRITPLPDRTILVTGEFVSVRRLAEVTKGGPRMLVGSKSVH